MRNDRENHNYRIGTDILPDGRVRAKARGRKTNSRTFPAGTTPEDAAMQLALKIEQGTVSRVVLKSSNGADKADYAVYTTFEATAA